VINEAAIKAYLHNSFKNAIAIDITRLGSGVQGSGFLIEVRTSEGIRSYVIKSLLTEGLGHDYPSDRAAVFLLDLDEYKNLPNHVKAIDVLSEMEDGSIKSIGGGREYYLLMERAEGRHYFNDLKLFAKKGKLDELDRKKIKSMTAYLAGIHSVKKDSSILYRRKLRDTVGHGECLMGVFDTYPDGVINPIEMSNIIKKSIDWIIKLKPKYKRLSQIHGDFHPGNIWFTTPAESLSDGVIGDVSFILLDRSRGPWGEPADDVSAMTINYIFFSVVNYGDVRGAYLDGLRFFFDEYIRESGDEEITAVAAPFFAFRGAVVANPVFYPEVTTEHRHRILLFIKNILDDDVFDVEKVNNYLR
jgi:hypothetical protein